VLSPCRLVLPLLTAVATASPVWASATSITAASVKAGSEAPATKPIPVALPPASSGVLMLKVRRSATSIDLLVEGTGQAPMLQQKSVGDAWQGLLRTSSPTGLRLGPQRISLPEAGLQSVSISGTGSEYQLDVVPAPGLPIGRPVVSADGRNLLISFPAAATTPEQTASLDLRNPGSIPQPAFAPPLQPRAVAPPLGDMAVGSMVLRNRSFINVSGPRVTMTLRNAPARDALMSLAQMGGYGFVYVDDVPTASVGGTTSAVVAGTSQGRSVSIAFQGESYSRALNSVLLAAGLQGRLEGNLIFAGPSVLSKSFGTQLSKNYRLNQASVGSAADYLASLGASITKVNVITNSVSQGTSQTQQVAGASTSQQTTTQNITTTETYGGGVGPLKGLIGTTDSRLQSITLIGEPQLVSVAESYLKQIDLRQRQVALSVKILDVSLDNDAAISNSFAFRYGNNFIVSDRGQLVGAFGSLLPPRSDVPGSPGTGAGYPYGFTGAPANPGQDYPANNFFNVLQALVTSSSAKTLASPTLFLTDNPEVNQAGGSSGGGGSSVGTQSLQIQPVTDPGSAVGRNKANEAFVVVGENVIQSYSVTAGSGTSPNTCQPIFGVAGLTLGARVKRIDDNGFVTFNLSPAITAVTRGTSLVQGCGVVNTLTVRAMDSGDVRVRDGQTLILTGVISDSDLQAVRKWPILGDIPFVGQFFRDSGGTRKKRELVILVTPRIVNDGEGGTFGYGYRPETRDAARLLGS
jgi:type IV pilus assembly protein PilQ